MAAENEVELGLEEEWNNEAVGTENQWGTKLIAAIAKWEGKAWKEEMKRKPKLRTFILLN